MQLPFSIINLSSLATRAGEGDGIKGAEVLAACGFPSADRTPLHPVRPDEGDQRYEEKDKEEREAQEKADQRQCD